MEPWLITGDNFVQNKKNQCKDTARIFSCREHTFIFLKMLLTYAVLFWEMVSLKYWNLITIVTAILKKITVFYFIFWHLKGPHFFEGKVFFNNQYLYLQVWLLYCRYRKPYMFRPILGHHQRYFFFATETHCTFSLHCLHKGCFHNTPVWSIECS
jgi:hypothetical protein